MEIPQFLQFRARIPYRSGARTGQRDGRICAYRNGVSVAGNLYAGYGRETIEQRTTVGVIVPVGRRVTRSGFRPNELVPIQWRFLRSETVTRDVFRHDTWH